MWRPPLATFLLSARSPGTLAQGRGLLAAMGVRDDVRMRVIDKPSAWTPFLLLSYAAGDPWGVTYSNGVVEEVAAAVAVADAGSRATGETAVLVVACGHSVMATAAQIKRRCRHAVFVVAVQHPQCRLSDFDLVITPAHDWLKRPQLPGNVFLTHGALHTVSTHSLQQAAESQAAAELRGTSVWFLALVVGGPTAKCRWEPPSMLAFLAAVLEATAQDEHLPRGGTVLITASRRTPSQLREQLRQLSQPVVPSVPKVVFWEGPMQPVYTIADVVVVSADSTTMVSEACATPAQVFMAGAQLCTGKFVCFHHYLTAHGLATSLALGPDQHDDNTGIPQVIEALRLLEKRTSFLCDTERAAEYTLQLW
eukprot:CAMPEP_0117664686 /NCGR_PEP_ID=MMETSP0804-20121206/9366_1 /TAXON_ID=1074897 /ORGANISM="Tetraselmis astigmatica, Strain CCMP880" /LENGTH=365 /DNA_ID=CAMNT_0005471963 /DNA_START=293 /DNA_END=1387 /DNA_ORIENTATION=-